MSPAARGLQRGMTIVIAILVPFLLVLGIVRVLFTPASLSLEYNMPYFPPDAYGFTTQDRLHWATPTLEYLFNDAGISYLADLKFSDGTPIYNERELSHMTDVKRLFQVSYRLWRVGLVVMVLLALAAWRLGWVKALRSGISWGGWIIVGLVVAVLGMVAISFNTLFTDFHQLFFQGNSWLFYYSDTLIRLFPIRLWMDIFIAVGVLSLIVGAALGWFVWPRESRVYQTG